MKTSRVMKLVDTHRPKTVEDALITCGLSLKYVGDGAYRYAYEVVGSNLVIKFPKGTDCASTNFNKQHSIDEYRAIRKVLRSKARRMQGLKKHMPKVYYCNQDGIMIVRKYKMLPLKKWTLRETLSNKVCSTLKLFDGDINNSGNVGVDGRGTLKVLDAGYLGAQW